MKNKASFDIVVPQNIENKKENNSKKERRDAIKDAIKMQYDEVYKNQDVEINENNQREIENLILATQDLIDNCMRDVSYSGNRDEKFVNLIYICHKLDLKLETYKVTQKIDELNLKSMQLEILQDSLNDRQNKTEEQNNNLVYNLLGFLTAFSIVSAVVGVVAEISGTLNIMLFMAFTILILLTTLIALHNFYKNNNKRESKLQNNYFLWKIVAGIFVFLIITIGMKTLFDNKDKIFNYLDNKIEQVIEEKVTEKLEKELAN